MSNYNLTNLTDANNIVEYSQAANALTGDIYFTIINAAILLIVFVNLKRFDTQTAFMSASFIASATAGVLWAVGLMGEPALLVFFVLFVLSVGIRAFQQ